MKFTFAWLQEHLETDSSLAQISEALNMPRNTVNGRLVAMRKIGQVKQVSKKCKHYTYTVPR